MKASKWLILLVLVIAVSWGMYECKYYYSQWLDYRNSPWAYSRNENAKQTLESFYIADLAK